MVFSFSSSVSRTVKAMPSPCCAGCADWWQGEGSIDLNLPASEVRVVVGRVSLLLAQEVAEVGDRVLCVTDELALRLSAVELFSLDVRQRRRDLAVWQASAVRAGRLGSGMRRTSVFVGDDLNFSFLACVSASAAGHVQREGLLQSCRQWSCTSCQRTGRWQPAVWGRFAHSSWAGQAS
jgi:hypothetical protein